MSRVCFLLLLLSLLSGCVYLDIACQDTAVPLYPKRASGSMYLTNGILITQTYYLEDAGHDDSSKPADTTFMNSLKTAVGISPKVDLIFNASITSGELVLLSRNKQYKSNQYELGMKYLVSKSGKNYLSVLPSIYYAVGWEEGDKNDSYYKHEYRAQGLEGQILFTHKASELVSLTGAAGARNSSIITTLDGVNHGPFISLIYGLRGNVKINAGGLFILPELGIEVIPVVNGDTITLPVMSFGFGFQL